MVKGGGDSGTPYSSECNPSFFCFGDLFIKKVYSWLICLKKIIRIEFETIAELLVTIALLSLKKRGELMVQDDGMQFEFKEK